MPNLGNDRTKIRIVKKGSDDSNWIYWASLTGSERLSLLEKIRKQVIKEKYGADPGFQRVYRIVKRT